MKKDTKITLQEIYKTNKEDLLAFIGKEMNTKEVMRELIENGSNNFIKSFLSIKYDIDDENILDKTTSFFAYQDVRFSFSDSIKDFVNEEKFTKEKDKEELEM